MVITIHPSAARLTGDYDHAALDAYLSYMAPGYQFNDAFKRKRWDGRVRLLTRRGEFPVGLVARVAEWFEGKGEEVVIDNRLPKPPGYKNKAVYKTLRDYQQDAVYAALENVRGILQLATGAGKTNVAAGVIDALDRPSIFLVHTKDLMYQAVERFKTLLDPKEVGMLGDGQYIPGRFLVATMQTTCNLLGVPYEVAADEGKTEDYGPSNSLGHMITTMRPDILNREVIIIDECQHAACETMQTIVKDLKHASYVLGLSATPWRDDGKDLDMEGVLGQVIYQVSASQLIEMGHLMAPEIKCIEIEKEPDLDDADYPTLYKLQIVENPERNRFIGKLAHQNKKQGRKLQLIIVRQLKHVDLLMKALRPRQLVAVSLTGKESGAVRQDKLNLAKAGAIDVIVATTVADEGLDLPMLDTVILAGGGRSTARALQRVGRAIRKFPNKLEPVVYDLFDENLSHQCNARFNAYRTEEGYKVVRV